MMNHWVKKAGIINSERQMIPLPPPSFHALIESQSTSQSMSYFPNHAPSIIYKLTGQILDNV